MKIYFKAGKVRAEAETMDDITTLLSLNDVGIGKKHRKHKRHEFKKTCAICGRGYKGSRGLGIHMAKCKRMNAPVGILA